MGFESREIFTVDSSSICKVSQLQMGYRPEGVKSHSRDNVYSQNFLEAWRSLGHVVHWLLDLVALKKTNKEKK